MNFLFAFKFQLKEASKGVSSFSSFSMFLTCYDGEEEHEEESGDIANDDIGIANETISIFMGNNEETGTFITSNFKWC
jgi:hypothetical protein